MSISSGCGGFSPGSSDWSVEYLPAAVAGVTAFLQSSRFNEYNYGGDGILFVRYGQELLSPHWDRAFSNSDVQAGPLQLLFFGSLARKEETIAIILGALTALLVAAAARAAGVRSAALLGGVGLLAVVSGLIRVRDRSGHPADVLLPLIWVVAADQARRDHRWRAGLLIGLCAVPQGTAFGWPLRLVQAALAVSAGIAVARALRHSPHAIWVVLLAVVAVRLLLDPILLSYYLAEPKGLIFVGAAAGAAHWTRLRSTPRESFA